MIKSEVKIENTIDPNASWRKALHLDQPVNAEWFVENITFYLQKIYEYKQIDYNLKFGMLASIKELIQIQTSLRNLSSNEFENFMQRNLRLEEDLGGRFVVQFVGNYDYIISEIDRILYNYMCPVCKKIIPGKNWHSDEDCHTVVVENVMII